MGLDSLPVVFGVDKAKWICAASIDLTQLAVAAYLALIGETIYAEVLVGLVVPQMVLQVAPPRDAWMPLGAARPINSIRRCVARDCTCSATRSSTTSSTKRARSRSSCSASSRPPSRAPTPGSRLARHTETCMRVSTHVLYARRARRARGATLGAALGAAAGPTAARVAPRSS